MTKYSDKRGLPVCYDTIDAILLDDEKAEKAPNQFPTARRDLMNFDMELEIYKLTYQSGAKLPQAKREREELRAIIRKAIDEVFVATL